MPRDVWTRNNAPHCAAKFLSSDKQLDYLVKAESPRRQS